MKSRQPPISSAGFTLVEVALAIGIIAFAFVALLALLPAGNTAFRRAIDIAVCSQIAQRIIGEAQESTFAMLIDESGATSATDPPNYSFRAPARLPTGAALRYFDDQGREIIPVNGGVPTPEQRRQIVYQVNTRVMTRVPLPQGSNGPGPSATSNLPALYSPMAQITVQVAHNPAGIDMKLSAADPASTDPMRNLWINDPARPGIDILTYSALIARAK